MEFLWPVAAALLRCRGLRSVPISTPADHPASDGGGVTSGSPGASGASAAFGSISCDAGAAAGGFVTPGTSSGLSRASMHAAAAFGSTKSDGGAAAGFSAIRRPVSDGHTAFKGGAAEDLLQCLALAEAAVEGMPDELALAGFGDAADFADLVEELSRRVDYLQLLAADAVDRTRAAAINAAGPASKAAGWTTGWGIEATPLPGDDASATGTDSGAGSVPGHHLRLPQPWMPPTPRRRRRFRGRCRFWGRWKTGAGTAPSSCASGCGSAPGKPAAAWPWPPPYSPVPASPGLAMSWTDRSCDHPVRSMKPAAWSTTRTRTHPRMPPFRRPGSPATGPRKKPPQTP